MRFCVAAAAALLAGCGSTNDKTEMAGDPVLECVQRGIAYFKQIGSYPVLHAEPNVGKAAEEVALDRYRRTTTAF